MIDFSVRSTAAEVMDDLTDPADYAACLADLARVNRVTFTHYPILRWLGRVTRGRPAFRLLDVACGHGDLLRAIAGWARRRGMAAELEGIDLNPGSAVTAAAATPPGMAITWRTGNVFDYAPEPKPDFIVSSQFTHHLDDAQLVQFLHWMDRHAGTAWCIADIHRHWLAYYGFRVLSWAARWHPVVRGDGAISVLRSFRRADLVRATEGLPAKISWQMPFRWIIEKQVISNE